LADGEVKNIFRRTIDTVTKETPVLEESNKLEKRSEV
jgi:hypothetical protein